MTHKNPININGGSLTERAGIRKEPQVEGPAKNLLARGCRFAAWLTNGTDVHSKTAAKYFDEEFSAGGERAYAGMVVLADELGSRDEKRAKRAVEYLKTKDAAQFTEAAVSASKETRMAALTILEGVLGPEPEV